MDELKPGWQRVKFGDVVHLNKETCKDPEAEGIERVIGLEHLEPGELRIRSWGDVADGTTFTKRVRPGQLLFGKRRAYQRKAAVADFDAVCSGDIYVMESANPDRLLPELLPFLCQADAFFEHAVGTSAGSLSPRTNWASLASYELALPTAEQQRNITKTLLSAQTAAQEAANLSSTSAALANSFLEASIGHFYRESDRFPLTELCPLIMVGIVVTPAKFYVSEDGVPALRSLNVWPGRFDLDDMKELSQEGHLQHSKSELQAGDVVLVRTGDPGRPGNAAVITEEMAGWNCIDLVLVRPGSMLRPKYLESFFNWSRSARLLNGISPGTKQKHLSVTALTSFQVAVPPLKEQDEFLERLQDISRAASISNSRLQAIRNTQVSVLRELLGLS